MAETARGLVDLLGPGPSMGHPIMENHFRHYAAKQLPAQGFEAAEVSPADPQTGCTKCWLARGGAAAQKQAPPQPQFMDLPEELQALIIVQLDGQTRHTMPLVCKQLRRVCEEQTGVIWPGVTFPLSEIWQNDRGEVAYTHYTSEELQGPCDWMARHMHGLKRLVLDREDSYFTKNDGRKELSLTYTPLLIPVLEICQRGALTSLEFGPVTVRPELLEVAGQLHTLENLSAHLWTDDTEAVDRSLAGLTRLTSLHLGCDHAWSAHSLHLVRNSCSKLQSLQLGGHLSLGESPEWLTCFPHLTQLSVETGSNYVVGLPKLTTLTALQSLKVHMQSPTVDTLAELCPKQRADDPAKQRQHAVLARVLKCLSLFTLDRTNEMAAIGALEGLTSLEELNFNKIKGLTGIPAYVAQLPLKELSLCYCPVTSLPPSGAAMWKTLKRLTLAPEVGKTTKPLVEAVKASAVALEHLFVPECDALAGLWTSAVATRLPKLQMLTLTHKVEFGGAAAEGEHRLVHSRELATLVARLTLRRPLLEISFTPIWS